MKKLLIISALIFSISYAEFENTFSQIDIPTALLPATPGYAEISIYTHFGLRKEWNYVKNFDPSKPFDFDLYGTMALGNVFGTLKIYTLTDWALDIIYRVMPEIGGTPAVAVGIYDLTYRKHISSTGSSPPEGGYNDDNSYYWDVWKAGDTTRMIETFSLFLVASKHLSYQFILTAGLGRGRFVGYGPRSRLFNFDIFTGSKHNWTFGLFWGLTYIINEKYRVMVDFDGRDFNIGFRYTQPMLAVNIAITKFEHFFGSWKFSPRLGFSVIINPKIFKK